MAFFDHDFFDELTDKLASAGKAIGEKAKEVTDSAKTSLQIAQEEKNLRAAYRQLGMYIYEKSGIEADEAMAPYFAAITETKLNLEALKNSEKKADRAEKACDEEVCDEEVCDEEDCDEDDCDEMESELVEPEKVVSETAPEAAESAAQAEPEAAERVCAGCKSVVSSQLIYCPNCGAKMK